MNNQPSVKPILEIVLENIKSSIRYLRSPMGMSDKLIYDHMLMALNSVFNEERLNGAEKK